MSDDYLDRVVGELKAKEDAQQIAAQKENRESAIKTTGGPQVFLQLKKWLKTTTGGLNAKMARMVIEYKDSTDRLELRMGGTGTLASNAKAQLMSDDSINYETLNPNINGEPFPGVFRPTVVNGDLQYRDSANKSVSVQDMGEYLMNAVLGR